MVVAVVEERNRWPYSNYCVRERGFHHRNSISKDGTFYRQPLQLPRKRLLSERKYEEGVGECVQIREVEKKR